MSSSFRQPVDKKARSEQEDPTLKLAVLRDRMSAMLRVTLSDVAERTELAADAGQIKRRLGMPILDMQREKVVIEEAGKYAETLGLSKEEGEELAFWSLESQGAGRRRLRASSSAPGLSR